MYHFCHVQMNRAIMRKEAECGFSNQIVKETYTEMGNLHGRESFSTLMKLLSSLLVVKLLRFRMLSLERRRLNLS